MASWDDTIRRLASLPAAADSKDPFDAEAAIASFTKRIQDSNLDDKNVKAFRKAEGCIAASPGSVGVCRKLPLRSSSGDALRIPHQSKITWTEGVSSAPPGASYYFH